MLPELTPESTFKEKKRIFVYIKERMTFKSSTRLLILPQKDTFFSTESQNESVTSRFLLDFVKISKRVTHEMFEMLLEKRVI